MMPVDLDAPEVPLCVSQTLPWQLAIKGDHQAMVTKSQEVRPQERAHAKERRWWK